ncbi:MAG: fibronectin type III domain-containing protein [Ruminococcus sp.]|nr:fibronectin type III domain-containing protein [Ruminococcus sp.]
MVKARRTLIIFSAFILIFAFSFIVSAENDLADSYCNDEIVEFDCENDPLYIKYLNQPMTMASISGASNLTHNKTFSNYDKVYGVDVSYFQNTVNWKKVKAAGIDFAIIRVGYRGYGDGTLMVDSKFKENLVNAKAAGVDVGVYFFTQAINITEAKQEANYVLKQIKGYSLEMPVYIDMEEISYDVGRFDKANLSYSTKTNICKAFCETIENAGYRAGVYASNNCFTYHFDGSELAKSYDIWVAHYNNYTNYSGEYQMWQYTGTGRVNGITTTVDMNVLYMKKGPDKINNLKANGYGKKTTLSWDKSFGAHGYAIYAKDLKSGKISEVAKTSSTSKTVDIPYEKSRFYIKAYYNIGTKYAYSPYSTGVSAFKNYLPEVTGFSCVKTTCDMVSLSWEKMNGCDGYIVYKYDNSQKKYIRIVKTEENINNYKVTGLSPKTTYKFAVKAYKTVNEKEIASGSYPSISVITNLKAVTGFKVSSTTTNAVTLSWGKYANAQGYIIYKYDNSDKKWVRVVKTTKNENSYTVKNLNSGVTYKFAIKAYITSNGKEIASSSYPTISALTRFDKVGGINSNSSSKSIKLSWNRTYGANGYIVYQYKSGKWVRIAQTSNSTYTIKNLSPGSTYWFTVKAYKIFDNKEVSSMSFNTYKTSTDPETVNFNVTTGKGKATLKWNKVKGATGYIAYYKTSANGSWKRLTVTTGTSYTKTGLTSGKTYYFTVKAYRNYNGNTYNGSYQTISVKIK